ncbi:MAG: DUF6941 family protein [Motilibacteraceae bacterium]
MRATTILCDFAQVAEGKLFVSGGGWNQKGPDPAPAGIGMLLYVPWDRANQRISFLLQLRTGDGQVVQLPGPVAMQEVAIGGEFEVGRPVGLLRGEELVVPLAIALPPLPLTPGRYEWRLSIDGVVLDDARLPFTVRSQPLGQPPQPPQPPGHGPSTIPPAPNL